MDSLPDDIIIQILACLPPEEVSKAGLINKHFRYLCNSEQYVVNPYLSITKCDDS